MPRARTHQVWCPGLDGRITTAASTVATTAVPAAAPVALERTG
jgi:hypothetical protein